MRSDEDLLLALPDLQSALNEASGRMYALVAEVERRGLAGGAGCTDTADLLRSTQNISRSTARARVAAATDLEPQVLVGGTVVEARLPVLAEAVREAAVSADHVRVVQRVLGELPPHLDEHRADLEAQLVRYARLLDPDAVLKIGRRALAVLDPDGRRPREPKPTRNRLTLRPLGGGVELLGWFDAESAAILRSALSPLTAPAPAVPGDPSDPDAVPVERDERSAAERNGDGLVELARRLLAADALGTEAGEAVRLVVTVPLETLETRTGTALLSFGEGGLAAAIDAETALRLACDARTVPIVLATTGEPLFVGREHRSATRAQRRALAQRDGGCAFPGCEAPPQWCVAHHIRFWAHGGHTDLDNLVLLCGRHHRVIHRQDWRITMDGGFPLFHPPPWVPGGPRRNPLHRSDLVVPPPVHRRPVAREAVPACAR